jgi:integrase
VFKLAKPAWGYPLDPLVMRDAMVACRMLGYVAEGQERERRPTLDELDALMGFFAERSRRDPTCSPMHKIIAFAVFSTRRQDEICRIVASDLDRSAPRVMVRDMKHPGQKVGNDVWCDLPEPCLGIIDTVPRRGDVLFPYKATAISAAFTRACKLLGIRDLHFHDLRHEGISRLFEMGMSIPQVAAVSGHRSWDSLRRYTQIRQAGDKFEGWKWLPVVKATWVPSGVRAAL